MHRHASFARLYRGSHPGDGQKVAEIIPFHLCLPLLCLFPAFLPLSPAKSHVAGDSDRSLSVSGDQQEREGIAWSATSKEKSSSYPAPHPVWGGRPAPVLLRMAQACA